MSAPQGYNARQGVQGFQAVPIEERFWAKVDRRGPDECWEWRGARGTTGYGFFVVGAGEAKRNLRAHRVSWELHHNRSFPEGSLACHTCDNRGCVNPLHIWPGSAVDNARDMVAKGRAPGPKKTRCPRGHPYDEANTYWFRGTRSCLACRKSAYARASAQKMEAE